MFSESVCLLVRSHLSCAQLLCHVHRCHVTTLADLTAALNTGAATYCELSSKVMSLRYREAEAM